MICCLCSLRGARLCCWSTWPVAWPAPSPSPPTWTSRPSTTSSWRAATAATSSTSPRGQVPRSTSLTPTAPRRNPQSTFRGPLNRSAWHGSTSWCVLTPCLCFVWHLVIEKNDSQSSKLYFCRVAMACACACGSFNGCHCFINITMACVCCWDVAEGETMITFRGFERPWERFAWLCSNCWNVHVC